MTTLCVNGDFVQVNAHPSTPLIWILREHLGLIATKYGCDHFECGACSVQINGKMILSCSLPLSAIQTGDEIKTVEAFTKSKAFSSKSYQANL
jgi:aerobic-type carbon monoxide dehydrogenase small subunit (CoxS/CutS family)